MLALHYLIAISKIWLFLFIIFRIEKPKYLFLTNGIVILGLVITDVYRWLTFGSAVLFGVDVVIEIAIIFLVIIILVKSIKVLFVLINIFLFNSLITSLTSSFILIVFGFNTNVLIENVWFSLLGSMLGLLQVVILCIWAKKKHFVFEVKNINFKTAAIVAITMFSYGFYLTAFLRLGNEHGQIINFIAATAGALSIFIMIGFLINHHRVVMMTIEADAVSEIAEMQKLYYEQILIKDEETRKFRHDTNNHLLSLSSLIENDSLKAKEYLESLTLNLDVIENIPAIFTGSELIDSLLNYMNYKFSDDNIDLIIDAKLPDNLGLQDYDTTTLFSNLFSNAFEAATKVDNNRYVKIISREQENFWFLAIKNNFDNSGDLDLTKTTKSNKSNHGFGIQKIKDIVKKYQLDIEFLNDDNEFIVEIMFPKYEF